MRGQRKRQRTDGEETAQGHKSERPRGNVDQQRALGASNAIPARVRKQEHASAPRAEHRCFVRNSQEVNIARVPLACGRSERMHRTWSSTQGKGLLAYK